MKTPLSILQQYWQYPAFRGVQEQVIQSILEGKDTLALLPTGGGKSICFQVPALIKGGVCLVISPLIALMKDQVENLHRKDIGAVAIHSGLTKREVAEALKQVASDESISFLYVSPERLETLLFSDYVDDLDIRLVAVDEAHCISQWGYDFRPSYLRIARLRQLLPPRVPFLALTASATPMVQDDIIDKLQLKQAAVFRQSFERPALGYRVFAADAKIDKLTDILSKVRGSSIVYCATRRRTQDVTRLLQLQGIQANFYHAGLSQDERNERQQAWIQGLERVIVCTNAFGMGIDKPDVRTVVHYDVPDCVENYYQEAGRAGRDGNKAYAVLLYQHEDKANLLAMPDMRYPSLPDIRSVYQALADYLQIPVGIGQGNYYDFDFSGFVQNFHIDARLAMNAIKVLEQEGHLSFKENVFIPAKVVFTTTRDQLEQLEEMYPLLDDVAKALLRSYEGIYDNLTNIYDKHLARLTRRDTEQINIQLQQLHHLGIIEYYPQKETPQLQYLLNRAPANFLHIDLKNYEKRKELYTARVQAMLQYIDDTTTCRSSYIAAYFGEQGAKDCGICDNCRNRKQTTLSDQEFERIRGKIIMLLQQQSLPVKDLMQQLYPFNENNSWQVIQFLLAEEVLVMDELGVISQLPPLAPTR